MSDTIGYSKQEVIALSKLDMDMLAGLALPDTFTLTFPPIFKSLWTLITDAAQTSGDFTKVALGLPRGFGKTAVIKLFALYIILHTKRKFVLITGANQSKAENILADVMMLLSEPNIIKVFGDYRHTVEMKRADLVKFTLFGKTTIIAALGSGGDPRGLNIKFARPDVIIMDDIQSRENSMSKTQSNTLRDWMFATLMKTKAPTGCLYTYIGNMFPSENCILRELKESPDWISFIVCVILAYCNSLWEDLHSKEQLLKDFEQDIRANNAHFFLSEMLNDPSTEAKTGFDFRLLTPWQTNYDTELPDGKFIVIDPSGRTMRSDDCVIGLFEERNNVPWLVKFVAGKFSPKETIEHALDLAMEYSVPLIAIENVAYQDTLLFWFEETIKTFGIEGVTVVPVNRGGESKLVAILRMFRQLQAAETELGLHPSVRSDVIFQIREYDPDKSNNKDDLLDVLAYAPKVLQTYKHQCRRVIYEETHASPELLLRNTRI